MDTVITTPEGFTQKINNTLKELKGGSYITVYFNGDSKIICFCKGEKLFQAENIDITFANSVKSFLNSNGFHINGYRCSQNAYNALFKRPRITHR